MKTYTMDNYEDLYDLSLKENDKVIFTVNGAVIIYTVMQNHLSKSGHTNSKIFDELGLDKYKYSSEKYGYNTESGSWPCYKYRDFNAATNLVLALFELCDVRELEKEKVSRKPKKPYPAERKPTDLRYNEVVLFRLPGGLSVSYIVKANYLEHKEGKNNSELFDQLGLTNEQKMQWAAWGYKLTPKDLPTCDWPETPSNNLPLLTNWVNEIHQILKIIRDEIELYDSEEDEEIVRGINFWKIIENFYKNKTPEKLSDKSNLSTNIKSENENGKIIKIQRVTPSVVRGEKRRGHTVQGKNSRTSVTSGHLGYRTIIG